jgi:hypothetical protein
MHSGVCDDWFDEPMWLVHPGAPTCCSGPIIVSVKRHLCDMFAATE